MAAFDIREGHCGLDIVLIFPCLTSDSQSCSCQDCSRAEETVDRQQFAGCVCFLLSTFVFQFLVCVLTYKCTFYTVAALSLTWKLIYLRYVSYPVPSVLEHCFVCATLNLCYTTIVFDKLV